VTRLLLDQGLPRSTARHLEPFGIQATHVADIGLSRADDSQIVERARQDGCVIVTLDADFHALIALSGAAEPSVVRIRREGLNGAELANLIATVLASVPDAVARGALVTVTGRTVRVRHIPIRRGT
jgi:predicted nuclease of predicted toxin-antitoxin system